MKVRVGGVLLAAISVLALALVMYRHYGIYVLARKGIYDARLIYVWSPVAWIGISRNADGVVSGSDSQSILVIARPNSSESRSAQWSNCIDLVDVNGVHAKWTRCLELDFQPRRVGISGDRKLIAIRGRERFETQDRVIVVDVGSSKVIHRFEFDEIDNSANMCWLGGTSTLVVQRGSVIVLSNPPDWKETPRLAGRSPVCLSGGRRLAYVNSNGRVCLISIWAGGEEERLPIEAVGDISVSNDGQRILFVDKWSGSPMVWKAEAQTSSRARFFPALEHPGDLEWIRYGGQKVEKLQ